MDDRTKRRTAKGAKRTAKSAKGTGKGVKATAKSAKATKRAAKGAKGAAKSAKGTGRVTKLAKATKNAAKTTGAAKGVRAVKPRKKPVAAATSSRAKAKAAEPRQLKVAARRMARRAIFIDVENTSHEAELMRVLDELHIDRAAQPTEVVAVGNWRSVAQGVARRLAALGASLVHSAPATGVRDWSDLWIAVAAGGWIAKAEPGDQIEILSDDRAFDAVNDAAASAGIIFRRISCRSGHRSTTASVAAAAPADGAAPRRRSRRGGRRRRRSPTNGASTVATASHVSATETPRTSDEPAPAKHHHTSSGSEEEAHGASLEQLREIIRKLAGGDQGRWIKLDLLANRLKSEGFSRPPGSPRLVTRLRKMKDVVLRSDGSVRLSSEGGPSPHRHEEELSAAAESRGAESTSAPMSSDDSPEPIAEGEAQGEARPRSRRRGGRRRRRSPAGEADTAGDHAVPASS